MKRIARHILSKCQGCTGRNIFVVNLSFWHKRSPTKTCENQRCTQQTKLKHHVKTYQVQPQIVVIQMWYGITSVLIGMMFCMCHKHTYRESSASLLLCKLLLHLIFRAALHAAPYPGIMTLWLTCVFVHDTNVQGVPAFSLTKLCL